MHPNRYKPRQISRARKLQVRMNLSPQITEMKALIKTPEAFFHGGNTGSNPVGDANIRIDL